MHKDNSDYANNKTDEKGLNLFRQGHYITAKDYLESLKRPTIADRILIARCHQKLNHPDTTERLLSTLIKEFPDNIRAGLSYVHFLTNEKHDFLRARKILAHLYSKREVKAYNYINYRDVLLAYAYVLEHTNELAQALRLYKELINQRFYKIKSQDDARVIINYVRCLEDAKQPKKALEIIKKAYNTSYFADNFEIFNAYVHALKLNNKIPEAIRLYDRCPPDFLHDFNICHFYLTLLLSNKNYTKGLTIATSAYEKFTKPKENMVIGILYANLLQALRKDNEAISVYYELLEHKHGQSKHFIEVSIKLAKCLHEKKDEASIKEALQVLSDTSCSYPNAIEAHLLYLDYYSKVNSLDATIDMHKQLAEAYDFPQLKQAYKQILQQKTILTTKNTTVTIPQDIKEAKELAVATTILPSSSVIQQNQEARPLVNHRDKKDSGSEHTTTAPSLTKGHLAMAGLNDSVPAMLQHFMYTLHQNRHAHFLIGSYSAFLVYNYPYVYATDRKNLCIYPPIKELTKRTFKANIVHDYDLAVATSYEKLSACFPDYTINHTGLGNLHRIKPTENVDIALDIQLLEDQDFFNSDLDITICAIHTKFRFDEFKQICALAISDPFHGLDDLKKGIIRLTRDPEETLPQKPLQMIRVILAKVKYGFTLDSSLESALKKHAHFLGTASKKQLSNSIRKSFLTGKTVEVFAELYKFGLWQILFMSHIAVFELPSWIKEQLIQVMARFDETSEELKKTADVNFVLTKIIYLLAATLMCEKPTQYNNWDSAFKMVLQHVPLSKPDKAAITAFQLNKKIINSVWFNHLHDLLIQQSPTTLSTLTKPEPEPIPRREIPKQPSLIHRAPPPGLFNFPPTVAATTTTATTTQTSTTVAFTSRVIQKDSKQQESDNEYFSPRTLSLLGLIKPSIQPSIHLTVLSPQPPATNDTGKTNTSKTAVPTSVFSSH